MKVEQHECFLSRDNAMEIISPYDFVIDCTDNFSPKYLINDACVFLDKPFCMGGINRFSLQLMTHVVGTACYRCLFPEPPREQDVETCAMTGVLGVISPHSYLYEELPIPLSRHQHTGTDLSADCQRP